MSSDIEFQRMDADGFIVSETTPNAPKKKKLRFKKEEIERVQGQERNLFSLTVILSLVAICSIFSGLLAMYVEASYIAYLAFIFPMFTSPYVIVQRRKIQKQPTLLEIHNKIRQRVNQLSLANARLSNENSRLERQVNRLSMVEDRLEQLVEREGKSIEFVKNLIHENGAIIREQKKLQMADEIQSLMDIVFRSDRDESGTFSEKELDRLMIRLSNFPGFRGKTFDEERLREAFKSSKTVNSLITIAESMADDEYSVPGDNNASAEPAGQFQKLQQQFQQMTTVTKPQPKTTTQPSQTSREIDFGVSQSVSTVSQGQQSVGTLEAPAPLLHAKSQGGDNSISSKRAMSPSGMVLPMTASEAPQSLNSEPTFQEETHDNVQATSSYVPPTIESPPSAATATAPEVIVLDQHQSIGATFSEQKMLEGLLSSNSESFENASLASISSFNQRLKEEDGNLPSIV